MRNELHDLQHILQLIGRVLSDLPLHMGKRGLRLQLHELRTDLQQRRCLHL